MSFEENIFKKYVPDFDALKRCGFRPAEKNTWQYETEIRFGQFHAAVRVSAQGTVNIAVFDSEGVEYPLIHVENANGDFVTKVRSAAEQLLLEIRDRGFVEKRYLAEQTGRIVAAVKTRYRETTDDPWDDLYPGYGVFRNAANRKWYALLMNVDGTKVGRAKGALEILNVKAAPEKIRQLLTRPEFYPAYHMNRVHWISIILDGALADEAILELIADSRKLTEETKKRRPKTAGAMKTE